eukprot:9225140-Alexandrium_andersonii.AAC.1
MAIRAVFSGDRPLRAESDQMAAELRQQSQLRCISKFRRPCRQSAAWPRGRQGHSTRRFEQIPARSPHGARPEALPGPRDRRTDVP